MFELKFYAKNVKAEKSCERESTVETGTCGAEKRKIYKQFT